MGKNSSIEWTHHTFNPWWGCAKMSDACENCYAEKWAKRTGKNIWGSNKERLFFTDGHWQEPLKWNKEAKKKKERKRVFCASMADVFEERNDLDIWREKLWATIQETKYLDWLLLTKRTTNIKKLVPWNRNWPDNVWIGATIENQKAADKRIPLLLENTAKIRFISCEPLLEKINISNWLGKELINWVIAGGESGTNARPTCSKWVRFLKEQCLKAKTPFLFKQWGAWRPLPEDLKGNHIKKSVDSEVMVKLSKKAAGRDLDGLVWNEVP